MMAQTSQNTPIHLYILRHALAIPSSVAVKDFDRALAPQGMEDAKALGAYMKTKNYNPELVLCSPAKRTKQTLENIGKSISPTSIEYHQSLYNGKVEDYLMLLQEKDAKVNSVLILAHNPCIYELAVLLSGRGIESHMQRLSEGYKPATLCVLSIPDDIISELSPASCELIDIVDPLDYNAPQRPTRWM